MSQPSASGADFGAGGTPKRVQVRPGECIGSGQCAQIAPDVFQLGPDERVRVNGQGRPLAPDRIPDVEAAIALCPVEALELADEEPDAPQPHKEAIRADPMYPGPLPDGQNRRKGITHE